METVKQTIFLNRRPVEESVTSAAVGAYRFGHFDVPVGAFGATTMMGRSGLMTQSQSMFIAWESGLEGDAVHIRHRNRSRWVELAELHPDDAEMLALAILEAVKKVRNE